MLLKKNQSDQKNTPSYRKQSFVEDEEQKFPRFLVIFPNYTFEESIERRCYYISPAEIKYRKRH